MWHYIFATRLEVFFRSYFMCDLGIPPKVNPVCESHNRIAYSGQKLHAVCSSFVLRCYANVVLPLKPQQRPSRFSRGVAQPG